MKKSPTTLQKRLRREGAPKTRPRFSTSLGVHSQQPRLPPPPPPPVQFNFNPPMAEEKAPSRPYKTMSVKRRSIKAEPLHAPGMKVTSTDRGGSDNPILIDVPPSLDDIKKETLPSTARSNYVRHSDMTEEQAKERRREQNRASARRTRVKTRHHIEVLERRYEDLRQKYTQLRQKYLAKNGQHADLPTFLSDPSIAEQSDDKWSPSSEERFESPPPRRRKKMKKEPNLRKTIHSQSKEIEDLRSKLENEEIENARLRQLVNFGPVPQPGLPRNLDLDIKHNLLANGERSTPPTTMMTNPVVLRDLTSPTKTRVNDVDGDVNMGGVLPTPPQLPRLEGDQQGFPSASPNDTMGAFGMPPIDMMGPPGLGMGMVYDYGYGGLGPAPSLGMNMFEMGQLPMGGYEPFGTNMMMPASFMTDRGASLDFTGPGR